MFNYVNNYTTTWHLHTFSVWRFSLRIASQNKWGNKTKLTLPHINYGGMKMVLCDVFLLYDDVVKSVKDEESFSDAIIRLARERNMSSPSVYHAAGIDARHYSKIISDRNYQPRKETVFAFILVFKLSLKEAEELLNKAGYSFCPASKYDLLIKSFIEKCVYDRDLIDSTMEALSLPLLPQKW